MPIRVLRWYTREMAQDNPNDLFVFGDNLTRTGFGGQARVLRGEPNAVGIPTKVSPSEYFTDSDISKAKPVIDAAYAKLAKHLAEGGTVNWPADGVGTGLARLEEKAPKIWGYLNLKTKELFNVG